MILEKNELMNTELARVSKENEFMNAELKMVHAKCKILEDFKESIKDLF